MSKADNQRVVIVVQWLLLWFQNCTDPDSILALRTVCGDLFNPRSSGLRSHVKWQL